MTCQQFLARHAEYLDDVMDPLDAAHWRDHAASCPACGRYDRVVRQGLRLWRELPDVEPSADFVPRLQHRIYTLDEELRAGGRASGAGAMLSLAIAGVMAFLAWSPMLRLDQSVLQLRRGVSPGTATAAGGAVPQAPARSPAVAAPANSPAPAGEAVQLAAEAEDADAAAVTNGIGFGDDAPAGALAPAYDLEEDASFIVPAPGGAAAWWWGPARPAAYRGATAGFPSVRAVDLQLPGPYSPLEVGVPKFRPASSLRRFPDPAGTRD